MHVVGQLLRYTSSLHTQFRKPFYIMNYRTEKNDRIRRRKARVFTALLTICMLAGFAYASGLLDELPFLNDEPATEVVAAPVA